MEMIEKKAINWEAPKTIVEAFDELATVEGGKKGKWLSASAAMLIYLEMTTSERLQYRSRISSMKDEPDVMKELLDARIRSGDEESTEVRERIASMYRELRKIRRSLREAEPIREIDSHPSLPRIAAHHVPKKKS